MSLDIELYTIEETPLDEIATRLRSIADELWSLRDSVSKADEAYDHVDSVAAWMKSACRVTHWTWNLAWYAVEWRSVKCHDLMLRPNYHGIMKASELVPYLVAAIDQLSAVAKPEPAITRSLQFLREYRDACQRFPDANVYTSG